MRLEYSNTADALYISLVDDVSDGAVVKTVEVEDGTIVDLLADGRVAGVEVLNPARSWPLDRILDDYPIAAFDEALLRSMLAAGRVFPFAQTRELVAV